MNNEIIEKLTESFRHFPGIGPRQAKRFVYHLLHAPASLTNQLLKQIEELKQSVTQCAQCFRFYSGKPKNGQDLICNICSDSTRDASTLMLVEKDIDLDNVLKSDTFSGYFFVLGGLVKILDKTPEVSIRARELLLNIEKRAKSGELREIIVALSANQEGDNTLEFLKTHLAPILEKNKIKLSTLGRGLSTGVELEYSDADTLKNALRNRQ